MTSIPTTEGNTSYPPPIITLSKSIIRPICPLDRDTMAHAANNPKIARNMRNRFPSPYTLEDAEWWIQNHPAYTFAIAHPTTNAVMGGIGLELGTDVECRTAELGYWVGEEYWGQGIMGEAAKAFLDWGFREVKIKDKDGVELGLVRIFSSCYAHNKGSAAVIRKAGLPYEGTSVGNVWKNGEVLDSLNFGMTREHWEKLKAEETV
jgi:ribosomal-protein-alanine N-acetyltransferase